MLAIPTASACIRPVLLVSLLGGSIAKTSISADVVVYGATGPGCVAAIAAARSGAGRVVLASTSKHVGGMTTGGLQHADAANESTIHGITREFFDRVEAHYRYPASPRPPAPIPGAPPGWKYEAHVAERVLTEMLAEANVTVVTKLVGLASVVKDGLRLTSATSETGVALAAEVWIDGTYEGDLAYAAGAEMVWGRESSALYNETGAGVRPPSLTYDVDPFWPRGEVIPHVSHEAPGTVGQADKRIEAYTFRLCMTNSPGNRLPLSEPRGYNASEWEFWRRLYRNGASPPADLRKAGLGCLGPIPNNYSDCQRGPCVKCDMLGMQHSTDMLNAASGWPNGTTAERKAIRQAHISYIQGLLWFWATDPASGDRLHQELAEMGYCTDEFLDGEEGDPPHWPYQLYTREARRMVGDYVWTEHDPPPELMAHSVGLGSYSFDSHWVSLYASQGRVVAEGRVNNGHDGKPAPGVIQAPYVVPYEVLLPKRSELTNVLVPVASSMSHVRQNAVRMEPAWMIQSHAAGTAAALAVSQGTIVQAVDVVELQEILTSQQRQMIWPCCPPGSARAIYI